MAERYHGEPTTRQFTKAMEQAAAERRAASLQEEQTLGSDQQQQFDGGENLAKITARARGRLAHGFVDTLEIKRDGEIGKKGNGQNVAF